MLLLFLIFTVGESGSLVLVLVVSYNGLNMSVFE
jgi:hypothetical protein